MTQTAIDLINLTYRLAEFDLADLVQEDLDRLATVPSIVDAHCRFEVSRRQRARGDE